MGHPFLIGMATGYSEVEIGYGEYMGCHHDSKLLFLPERSNNGTAVNPSMNFAHAENIGYNLRMRCGE
jgi:hypothetical protein